MNNVSLAEHSLVEFLQSAQQFINKGWVFDFTDSAHVPTSFGTLYTAVLIPDASQELIPSETKELIPDNSQELTPAEKQEVETPEEVKDETVTSQIDEPVEEQPKKRGRKPKEAKEG